MNGIKEMDYRTLGLKVGLEIHQQLDTEKKLFCNCSTAMKEKEPIKIVKRKLFPVAGELGEIDIAAQYEYLRNRTFFYEVFKNESCLVELDEEPPHLPNKEALEIALKVSLLLNCKVVDEVHFMRKTVIDGSNTSGFQRTALIAFDGYLEFKNKRIPIKTVCLEEDSCSLDKVEGGNVYYRLNRLGIPLVEIATGIIEGLTPKEIGEVAEKIGLILRSLKVKRGIGTIRQDVNVSIRNGARVEIKGVQKLELIEKTIELEVERQLNLLKIREELLKKGIKKVESEIKDVTEIFTHTDSRIFRKMVESGNKIYAFKLPGFSGYFRRRISGEKTLGKEVADYAKAFGLGGIIHTDEDLSKYKIEKEVGEVKKLLGANEEDLIVFVGEKDGKVAQFILGKMRNFVERGLEKETRAANEDGTTRFLRPMPGSSRMYPETDIPPIPISRKLLDVLKKSLPETLDKKLEKFKKILPEDLAVQLVKSPYVNVFEISLKKFKLKPTLVAGILVSLVKDLKRRGFNIENVKKDSFVEIFEMLAKDEIAKEAVEDILIELSTNPGLKVKEVVERLNLKVSDEEIERRIKQILKENQEIPLQKVFGLIMKEFRKKASAERVKKIFDRVLKEK